jgi:hypothetical protein
MIVSVIAKQNTSRPRQSRGAAKPVPFEPVSVADAIQAAELVSNILYCNPLQNANAVRNTLLTI